MLYDSYGFDLEPIFTKKSVLKTDFVKDLCRMICASHTAAQRDQPAMPICNYEDKKATLNAN